MRRLSSCGSRAQPLRGMWDPPRPGLEPVSPALAGRLSTTAPPGKPHFLSFCKINANLLIGFGSYSLKNTTLNCSGNAPPVFPPESAPLILWTDFLAFGLFSGRFLASYYLQTVPLVLALRPV